MQVTNIRVSFMREKQPAQYEKAQPSVELAAVLEDGEDHVVAARSLMMDAARVVYAGIGYDVPAKVAKALASGKVPPAATVETETKEATPEAPDAPEAAPEAPKKKRGRPVGSKNTQPKKGSKAADDQAAAGRAAAAKGDDGLPPEDEGTRQVSSNPEDRVNPDDGLPPEDGATDDGGADKNFTAKDLHDMIISAVQKKELSVPNAKQVLVHFKVARAQDLTNDQALEGKGMVEKMLAAAK